MQFSNDAWEGLADGSITVTFRRWRRRQVVEGHTYTTPAGMLEVMVVEVLASVDDIDGADVEQTGMESLGEIVERLGPATDDSTLYRVEFRHVGDDPRHALASSLPDPVETASIVARLARLDSRSPVGPWTRDTLRLISTNAGVRAADLAAIAGMETLPFKLNVRKLKGMGLTESLQTGYRLSERGQAILAHPMK